MTKNHEVLTAQTNFMRYWKAANAILKSHGLPPMMYGEAMDYWKDAEQA